MESTYYLVRFDYRRSSPDENYVKLCYILVNSWELINVFKKYDGMGDVETLGTLGQAVDFIRKDRFLASNWEVFSFTVTNLLFATNHSPFFNDLSPQMKHLTTYLEYTDRTCIDFHLSYLFRKAR